MQYKNIIEPENCCAMEDIHAEIDKIDRDIIAILAKRFKYLQAAAKFNSEETPLTPPQGLQVMLEQRREWAAIEGLDPDAIEKMYRDLVNHFIHDQLAKGQSNN